MDDRNTTSSPNKEKDIIFSKTIKAGKRIYYIDVKKDRHEDIYLSITESKKVVKGIDSPQINFEKHKIFLYKEDFAKFKEGILEALDVAENEQNKSSLLDSSTGEIKLDIDF